MYPLIKKKKILGNQNIASLKSYTQPCQSISLWPTKKTKVIIFLPKDVVKMSSHNSRKNSNLIVRTPPHSSIAIATQFAILIATRKKKTGQFFKKMDLQVATRVVIHNLDHNPVRNPEKFWNRKVNDVHTMKFEFFRKS